MQVVVGTEVTDSIAAGVLHPDAFDLGTLPKQSGAQKYTVVTPDGHVDAGLRQTAIHSRLMTARRTYRPILMSSPKIRLESGTPSAPWFRYYAGYSESFVSDVLESFNLPRHAVVLDPWNGTGTTTSVARRMGYTAHGYDINPVLVLVARARLLGPEVADSLTSIAEDVVSDLSHASSRGATWPCDPLSWWLDEQSSETLRSLEQNIHGLLVGTTEAYPLFECSSLDHVSSLAAFFYVALFRSLHHHLSPFKGSNPTWIKVARSDDERVAVTREAAARAFLHEVEALEAYVRASSDAALSALRPHATIDVGESANLTMSDGEADAAVTSPPYCTRLDYAIATLPELAVLGAPSRCSVKALRRRMLGTPTMQDHDDMASPSRSWGPTCSAFLDSVKGHPTKASADYYHRYYLQYFAGLDRSLAELLRVLRSGGQGAIVVQDSYYKDIHNDLPHIVSEMLTAGGGEIQSRQDFGVKWNYRDINSRSRRYRPKNRATEAVIVFQKV